MTKLIPILIATGLGLATYAGPSAAQDGGSVVIYRAGVAETVRFTDRGGVTVVRGQPAARPVAMPAAPVDSRSVVGGDTLWVVDGERLLACELRRTTQVGGRRIRCTERALPVAFR